MIQHDSPKASRVIYLILRVMNSHISLTIVVLNSLTLCINPMHPISYPIGYRNRWTEGCVLSRSQAFGQQIDLAGGEEFNATICVAAEFFLRRGRGILRFGGFPRNMPG